MILAAGRGERLKPLTELNPKALCTIHNIPLIEYHITKLAQAQFKRVIINHAYLGGKIRHYLGDGERFGIEIVYSPEPPGGLETGGGIVNALALLGNAPFISINADIYTNFDFASLTLPKTSLGHLILVKNPVYRSSGDFGLSNTQHIQNENNEYTFSGVACYSPQLFEKCQPGRYSITPLLRTMAENNRISGKVHDGFWFDIGSLERLRLAEELSTRLR